MTDACFTIVAIMTALWGMVWGASVALVYVWARHRGHKEGVKYMIENLSDDDFREIVERLRK